MIAKKERKEEERKTTRAILLQTGRPHPLYISLPQARNLLLLRMTETTPLNSTDAYIQLSICDAL